jgi:DNA-binding transcriptional MocR family regulator
MLCGSFTKTVAPGLRLGWIDGGRWASRVQRLKETTSGPQTPVLELALADLLSQPGQAASYRHLRATVAVRVDEARGAIAESFPRGTRVTDPPGGFILWLELPSQVDSLALFEACLAERICIGPGVLFSPTDRYRHCIRLGVGGAWEAPQVDALRRIGAIATRMAQAAPSAAPSASFSASASASASAEAPRGAAARPIADAASPLHA